MNGAALSIGEQEFLHQLGFTSFGYISSVGILANMVNLFLIS
jgi:hypothetical protein